MSSLWLRPRLEAAFVDLHFAFKLPKPEQVGGHALGTWWGAGQAWGPQDQCGRWGWGGQEAKQAHSVGSTLPALGRVLSGMASGCKLQHRPVGKQVMELWKVVLQNRNLPLSWDPLEEQEAERAQSLQATSGPRAEKGRPSPPCPIISCHSQPWETSAFKSQPHLQSGEILGREWRGEEGKAGGRWSQVREKRQVDDRDRHMSGGH